MSDVNTLARPYAKAAFELALQQKTLKEWSSNLQLLAAIVANEEMQAVLANPLVSKEQAADLILEIAGKTVNEDTENFVQLLAENKRLRLLPAISNVYEACLAEQERKIEVKVVSAFQIDAERLQKLQQALQVFLSRQVIMQFDIDKCLLGGVIIYAGDQVIDGSLRGKLNRLSERLCS